jgi:hypothetical protein
MALMFYQRAQVLAASLPKEVPVTDNPILRAGFFEGRLTAIDVAVRYLSLIVWPARLSADYSWNQIPIAHGSLGDWFCLVTLLALIPALVSLYRWDRRAFFLTVFALLWMAPVANLIFRTGARGDRLRGAGNLCRGRTGARSGVSTRGSVLSDRGHAGRPYLGA